MQDKTSPDKLNEVNELNSILIEVGLTKQVALVLTYIYTHKDTTSRNIESGTKLRQPEVSIAVQWLRRKGWIKKETLKRNTKGRPVHIYQLAIPFQEIITKIEEEEHRQMERRKELLQRLKTLSRTEGV